MEEVNQIMGVEKGSLYDFLGLTDEYAAQKRREDRLREEMAEQVEYIAKNCSTSSEAFYEVVPRFQVGDVIFSLEMFSRITVSLATNEDSEKIWLSLLDIWRTAYPVDMAALTAEQISLLHERSLHKLQSLAEITQIDDLEVMRAVFKELGFSKERIEQELGPEPTLN